MVDKALEWWCIEVYIQNDQIIGFQSNDIGDGRLFWNTSLQKCSIAYSDALENILKKPEQEDNISEILENLNKIYANTIKEILWFGDDTPILEAKKQGLWPEDKILTCEKWLDELESIGYRLFYRWKNADLYIIPDTSPIEVLMVRSDRTSVFDIPSWSWNTGKMSYSNHKSLSLVHNLFKIYDIKHVSQNFRVIYQITCWIDVSLWNFANLWVSKYKEDKND